ncbi:hypothetical protein ACFL6G_00335 [candidate division KSB1 bacterium]
MNRFIKILIIVIILCTGCSDNINYPEIPSEQKYLFEFEFINAAWGWNHYGFYIDNEGNIYKFESPLDAPTGDQWTPNSSGIYSEQELLQKYSMLPQFVGKINQFDLELKKNRIGFASKGELSDPKSEMNDAGSLIFKCYYIPEDLEKNDVYKEVILLQKGDIMIENLSPDGKYLARWLWDLYYELYTFGGDEK